MHDGMVTDRSWQYPALANAVWAFAPEALKSLKACYGTAHFTRPRYRDRVWRRDRKRDDLIREYPSEPVWDQYFHEDVWKGSKDVAKLGTFAEVVNVLTGNTDLYRRFHVVYGFITVYYSSNTREQILLFMQDCILYPMICVHKDFSFDEELMSDVYAKVESALASPKILERYYIALRDVRLARPFQMDQYTTVRILSDEELSQSINWDVVRPDLRFHRGAGSLDLADQYAVCYEKSIDVNESMLADPNLGRMIDALIHLEPPRTQAQRFVSALNLLLDSCAADIGGSWVDITTNLHGASHSGQGNFTGNSTARLGDLIVGDDELPQLHDLYKGISKKSTWSRLSVALTRFSSAATRSTPEEAILDLVISAESLFGSMQAGEIMHKISLNAALFVADMGFTPSSTRALFRTIYGKRSAIVHGVTSKSNANKTADNYRLQKELYSIMRIALMKAVLGLAKDQHYLDWDKRLDAAIDAFYVQVNPKAP